MTKLSEAGVLYAVAGVSKEIKNSRRREFMVNGR